MNGQLHYEEITLEYLDELAELYVETFNSEPWNDEWTVDTAKKRLHQIINTEDSYGICVYCDGIMCGGILGCVEQFYNAQMFNLKEFWVKNVMRGQGIGSRAFSELESRLREKQIGEIFLFTSKGDFTEHFYEKQNVKTNTNLIIMEKQLLVAM